MAERLTGEARRRARQAARLIPGVAALQDAQNAIAQATRPRAPTAAEREAERVRRLQRGAALSPDGLRGVTRRNGRSARY